MASVSGGPALPALYERRDVEPGASVLQRRSGSVRSTASVPNLLGASSDGGVGIVRVDQDFDADIAAAWTIFGTLRVETASSATDGYQRLLSFNGLVFYAKYIISANTVVLEARTTAGALAASTVAIAASNDMRFAVGRTGGGTAMFVNSWIVGGSVPTTVTGTLTFDDTSNELTLFGASHASLTTQYAGSILTNVLLYDAAVFSAANYETFAADITPATSISSPGTAELLWQGKLSEGGSALTYTNDSAALVNSYLVPSAPSDYAPDGGEATEIHFGGRGVIEVPFYPELDQYFWTTTTGSSRLEWCFQLEVRTSDTLEAVNVFELQDLVKLSIVLDSGAYKFRVQYNNLTATITSTVALAADTEYDVFLARDVDLMYIKVNTTEQNIASTYPVVFNYSKTIGFVIGDGADGEAQAAFGGRIKRFALHNVSTRAFQPTVESVMYYNVDSMYGDEVLDRGPNSMNAFAGIRIDARPPTYKEGGFTGGSYVAAAGGYLLATSTPSNGYTGSLRRPLLKDAVVQRQGHLAFLASNNEAYVVDDLFETFRPLGIPRPTVKASCTPQGIGPIDGFVRYGYRYVTSDGTVGPVFQLDPCDATGGVNVLIGAEGFGLPEDTSFGLSYGEAEVGTVANDALEHFVVHDDNGSGTALLHVEKNNPGLTLETAFRLPSLAAPTEESVTSQGVYMPFGIDRWAAMNSPKQFPWIGLKGQECCFQFSFRFKNASGNGQVLFGVGAPDQHYETGSGWTGHHDHYRLNHLVVSIQYPLDASNTHSLAVCRDKPSGSDHRDDDLKYWSMDYNFIEGRDYTVIVRRCGSLYDRPSGADLHVSIYDHTASDWTLWPGTGQGDAVEIVGENFWSSSYSGDAHDHVMWGTSRQEGSAQNVATFARASAGSATIVFTSVHAFWGGTTAGRGTRRHHVPRTYVAQRLPLHAACGEGARTLWCAYWSAL